jgi:hypothetical protein
MGLGPFKIIKILIMTALAALILGLVITLLWNALVPDLFHGPTITYLQSVGLFLLARLLFGNHGGGGGNRGRGRWQGRQWRGMHQHNWQPQGKWNWSWSNECEPGSAKEEDVKPPA